MYLPRTPRTGCSSNVTALSAPGSRIAAETAATHAEDRREEMPERFEGVRSAGHRPRRIDYRAI